MAKVMVDMAKAMVGMGLAMEELAMVKAMATVSTRGQQILIHLLLTMKLHTTLLQSWLLIINQILIITCIIHPTPTRPAMATVPTVRPAMATVPTARPAMATVLTARPAMATVLTARPAMATVLTARPAMAIE